MGVSSSGDRHLWGESHHFGPCMRVKSKLNKSPLETEPNNEGGGVVISALLTQEGAWIVGVCSIISSRESKMVLSLENPQEK